MHPTGARRTQTPNARRRPDLALPAPSTADGRGSIDVSDVLLARLDARDFKRYVCHVSWMSPG